MKSEKKWVVVLLSLVATITTSIANATLIGDTVNINWNYGSPFDVIVDSGYEYYSYDPGGVWSSENIIDISGNTIYILRDLQYNNYGGGGTGSWGIQISDLDWSISGYELVGYEVTQVSTWSGSSTLSGGVTGFTEDSIEINVAGAQFGWGGTGSQTHSITVELDFAPIPEPATILLLGLGGLVFRHKK